CQSNLAPTPAPTPPPIVMPASTLPPSMKGWELYSWQKDNQWRFVLFVGTNRLKTASEILSSEGAVIGVDGIQTELARLPKGEQVFWGSRGCPNLVFLPPRYRKRYKIFPRNMESP